MVVDTVGRNLIAEFLSVLEEQGYTKLAQQLRVIAKEGNPLQQKKVADAWVILHLNIGDEWRNDKGIKTFLENLNGLADGIETPTSAWWLRGAVSILTSARHPEFSQKEEFFWVILMALVPEPEVWGFPEQ